MTDSLPDGPALDPALWRGLTQRRMSRRDALGVAGKGAGLLGMAALLASCGIAGSAARRGPPVDWAAYWKSRSRPSNSTSPTGRSTSTHEHGKTESLEMFTKATGIKVNYEAGHPER